MSKAVESIWYIKCNNSSCPRAVKSPINSIRHNCQKICSWQRKPKTILEIRKNGHTSQLTRNSIIYKSFKDFTNHRKKTNRVVVFSSRPLPIILKYRDHQWDLPAICVLSSIFRIYILLLIRKHYFIHLCCFFRNC